MARWDIKPSDQIREIYQNDFGKIVRSIALDGLTEVVQRTPVDTGRARGGWFVTLGQATAGTTGQLDKGGQTTISAGASTIENADFGDVIVLQNNVDYAVLLDDGPLPYSRFKTGQSAPANMIDDTLQFLSNTFGS